MGCPPSVRVLDRHFGGRVINEPNLSAWRKGGFAEEQLFDKIFHKANGLAGDAKELAAAADGKITQSLSTVLAAHYAAALADWEDLTNESLKRKMRVLHGLTHHITRLRRNDLMVTRLKFQQETAKLR